MQSFASCPACGRRSQLQTSHGTGVRCDVCGRALDLGSVGPKVCSACGIDVSQTKRVKDERGRYFCHPCWAARYSPVNAAAQLHDQVPDLVALAELGRPSLDSLQNLAAVVAGANAARMSLRRQTGTSPGRGSAGVERTLKLVLGCLAAAVMLAVALIALLDRIRSDGSVGRPPYSDARGAATPPYLIEGQTAEQKLELERLAAALEPAGRVVGHLRWLTASLNGGIRYSDFSAHVASLRADAAALIQDPGFENHWVRDSYGQFLSCVGMSADRFEAAVRFWGQAIEGDGYVRLKGQEYRDEAIRDGANRAQVAIDVLKQLSDELNSPRLTKGKIIPRQRVAGTYRGEGIYFLTRAGTGFGTIGGKVYRQPINAAEFERIFGTPDYVEAADAGGRTMWYKQLGFNAHVNSDMRVYSLGVHLRSADNYTPARLQTDAGVGNGSTLSDLVRAFGSPSRVTKVAGLHFVDFDKRLTAGIDSDGKVQWLAVTLFE